MLRFLILLCILSTVTAFLPWGQISEKSKDNYGLLKKRGHPVAPPSDEPTLSPKDELLVISPGDVEEEGSGEEEDVTNTVSTITPDRNVTRGCFDQYSKCYLIKQICKSRLYDHIMIRTCAATCGFCKRFVNLPITERCRDSFQSCPTWAQRGFCKSNIYTQEERDEYCRKSCGRCEVDE